MTYESEIEMESLRAMYREAHREHKWMTCDLLAKRIRELRLRQIREEIKYERQLELGIAS